MLVQCAKGRGKQRKKYENSYTCKVLIDTEITSKIDVFFQCSIIHITVNTSIDLSTVGMCYLKNRRQNVALVAGKLKGVFMPLV